MRTTILSLITLLLFITSSPVYAGTIFEWMEFNGQEWEKPTDKSLIIEFEDTKVVGGSRLVGIENNIISLTFDYFSVGDGFILDIDDLQEPNDLIVKFNSDGDEIEFLQLVGHETSQATIWIGGFSLSYEGVMRFRGNLNSQPFNYAINGRRDNKPTSTTWDYSEVEGRFMKAAEPENQPPAADAGPDQTVELESPEGALVTLDGSASTDPDSTPETNDDIELFEWYEEDTLIGNGETLDYAFSLGEHHVILVGTDFAGETDEDEVIITVQDTIPPDVTLSTSPVILWPPNNKMRDIEIQGEATDLSGEIYLEFVVEDEYEECEPDLSDFDEIIQLKASRNGNDKDGRLYTIKVIATDGSENTASATTNVVVPHDKRKK